MSSLDLKQEILELKKSRNAVILAHNYQSAEIPDVDPGDYRGDLCLRIAVRDAQAPELQRQTVVRYFVGSGTAGADDDVENGGDIVDAGEESGRTSQQCIDHARRGGDA